MRLESKPMIYVVVTLAVAFSLGCGQNSLESLPSLESGSQNDGSGNTDPTTPTPANPP